MHDDQGTVVEDGCALGGDHLVTGLNILPKIKKKNRLFSIKTRKMKKMVIYRKKPVFSM